MNKASDFNENRCRVVASPRTITEATDMADGYNQGSCHSGTPRDKRCPLQKAFALPNERVRFRVFLDTIAPKALKVAPTENKSG